MTTEKLSFIVDKGSPERLDQYIIHKLTGDKNFAQLSRSQLKNWIEGGSVSVAGVTVYKAGARICPGDSVEIRPPVEELSQLAPWDFLLEPIYEDCDLLVIEKPAGLSVHPGAGNRDKTLVNALVHRYGLDNLPTTASLRPGIVHRLDKDTTGLLVIAKNIAVQNSLSKQFSKRSVKRLYKALLRTLPRSIAEVDTKDHGRIETLIGRHPTQRTRMSVLKDSGRKAVTTWNVLERYHYGSLVELKLETGRTHQIRVHMDYLKAPLIGDQVYGDFNMLPLKLKKAAHDFGRQALHAYFLGFEHPTTKKYLEFSSPLPSDFEALISVFRNYS